MSLEDWNGTEQFLAGEKPGEWIHMTTQEPLPYLEVHDDARYIAEALENDLIGDEQYDRMYGLDKNDDGEV